MSTIYTCTCGFEGMVHYSDHQQNCPIWLAGRIKSLETEKREASIRLLEVKQQLCKSQDRAYHWERCFIVREAELKDS